MNQLAPEHLNQLAVELIARIPYGVLVCNQDGNIESVNQALISLFGYSQSELEGKPVSLLVPDKFTAHSSYLQAYFKTDHTDAMANRPELFGRHKSGELIPVKINLLRSNHRAIALIRDNREIQQFNQHLDTAQKRFQEIFDKAPVAMAINDSWGNVTALNQAFVKLFGYTRFDIPTLDDWWPKAYPDEDYRQKIKDTWLQKKQQAELSGAPASPIMVKITSKEGRTVHSLVSACTLEGSFDREQLVILSDITDQELSRQTLSENEQRLNTMIERHQLPMILIAPATGAIMFANQSACSLYGYTKNELCAMRVHQLYRDDDAETDHYIQQVFDKKLNSFDRIQYSKDGRAIAVNIHSSPVNFGNHTFIYSIIIESAQTETSLSNTLSDFAFGQAITGVCLEDISSINEELKALKDNGVTDLAHYLANQPDELIRLAKLIALKELNPDALQRLGFESQQDLSSDIERLFEEDSLQFLERELLAIWTQIQNQKDDNHHTQYEDQLDSTPTTKEPVSSQNDPVPRTVTILAPGELNALKEELQFTQAVLKNIHEGVMITHGNSGQIVYTNDYFNQLFGYNSRELIGNHADILIASSSSKKKCSSAQVEKELHLRGLWSGEIENQHKSGKRFWCEVSISLINHPTEGELWLSVHSDITGKRDYNQRLWRQANYDSLTQLPNRDYFYDRAKALISQAQRTSQEFAVLFIDLDDFKLVNDTLGHKHGDALLIEVASRLEQCTRQSDLVARFGGDEFVILMTGIDDSRPSTIEPLIEEILHAIKAPYLLKGEPEYITASIGISTFPRDSESLDELIQFSDQAMYKAKESGLSNHHFFTPALQALAQYNRELERDLRKALKNNELSVYFQPIIDCQTREIHKAEALIRWHHPSKGMISPGDFIPVAEESELICNIGDFVFEQCLTAQQTMAKAGINPIQISLNKSPIQLSSRHFNTEYTWPEQVAKAGLKPENLCIEITEGLLLEERQDIKRKIDQLQNNGFYFSIDDFGTGYSALAYLQKVHFDYLKIDRAFIDSLEDSISNQALCEAIIVMAHKLGMKVIAEGVETHTQFQRLVAMSADYCQGYFFSKPIPLNDFIQYVANSPSAPH